MTRLLLRRLVLPCAVLLATTPLAAGCAGPSATRSDDRREIDTDRDPRTDADRLLAVGDFERAARLYRDALEEEPGSSVLREKLRTAERSAAQVRAAQALDAAARGDADVARRHLSAAQSYAPDAPIVRRTREQLEDVLQAAFRARDLVSRAEQIMQIDPQGAQDLLAQARQLDPAEPRIVGLLREATLRAEAERAARRAGEAWQAGRRDVAVRELDAARFAGRPVPGAQTVAVRVESDLLAETLEADLDTLRRAREISVEASLSSSAVRALRDRLVDALTTEASRLLSAGRPAVAALLETECRRLGVAVKTPALDEVANRARIQIVIAPFEDGTGGDVDGLRLARDLAARIEADARGGGAALGVIEPGPGQEQLAAAHPGALRLSGRAVEARVAEGPRVAITRRVPVQVDTRSETNPEALSAEAELRAVEARVFALRELVADAQEELDRLEAIPFVRGPQGRRIGQGRASYEIAISRAEARVANLRRRESDLQQEEAVARERLLATPRRREMPVYGEMPIQVEEFRKVAKLTVDLMLRDGDTVLLDSSVTGSALHDEVVAPAIPEAGLEADPDETPNDAAMARDAAAHFAAVAAGSIRDAAEQAARRFLVAAREAERAGRPVDAAEGYALYLLSTPDVPSPHRADAARALFELAGVRVPLRTGVEEDLR